MRNKMERSQTEGMKWDKYKQQTITKPANKQAENYQTVFRSESEIWHIISHPHRGQ